MSVLVPIVMAACVAPCSEWLPDQTDAPRRASSASRDAPVLEYAYGPRAQASVGSRLAFHESRRQGVVWRLEGRFLVALENAATTRVGPYEVWRDLEELAFAWQPWFSERADAVELELALGHQGAAGGVDLGEPDPDDIPFGGGGYWLAPALTFEADRGTLRWLVRGRYRLFANVFPELVGAKEASDFVTDALSEGLAHAPSLELSLRYIGWAGVQPVVSGFAEGLVPADDSARTGGFFRMLLGAAFPGGRGELLPFVSFDVGNGLGLLINRRQARLSFGVRHGF